jgi:hypothetical protein
MIIRASLYPEVPEKGMTERQKLVNFNVCIYQATFKTKS